MHEKGDFMSASVSVCTVIYNGVGYSYPMDHLGSQIWENNKMCIFNTKGVCGIWVVGIPVWRRVLVGVSNTTRRRREFIRQK